MRLTGSSVEYRAELLGEGQPETDLQQPEKEAA